MDGSSMKYTLDSYLPIKAFQPRGKIFAHGMTLEGGGGGGFIEDIGNSISNAFSSVSDTLSQIDPGPTIGNVGEEIDKGVNNAVPGGWGTIAAATAAVLTANPEILAAALPEEAAALTTEEILASNFADSAFQLTPDAMETALANGDISGLTSNATDMMLNGNPSLNPVDLANASLDPIQTLNAASNWTGPMTQNIGEIATQMAAQNVPSDVIANQLMQTYGIDQYAAANAAGVATAGGSAADIASTLASDYGANMTGLESASGSPLTVKDALKAANTVRQVAGVANTANKLLNPSSALPRTTSLTSANPSSLSGLSSLSDAIGGPSSTSGSGALPGNLQATSLAAAPVTQGSSNMNINQLKQLYPQLSTVDPRILSSLTGKSAAVPNYYTYGGNQSAGGTALTNQGQGGAPQPGYPSIAADSKGTATAFANPTSPISSYNALSSAGLHAINSGALPGQSYYKDGGNVHRPQFKTGTTGHFVQGAGDGQSDDIPAMLADGEYVFDADTVAALGNGSSKAGALQLDKMRKSIRKHKRSASTDKIPPKAKSPLDYLKG
jgi:hypothetical protein